VALAGAGGPSNIPSVQALSQKPTFAPATVVSPVLFGGEPQVNFERPVATPKAGAGLDPMRGFVDWPVSSRTMVGTLWRTTNGGDSYRQLVDLSCAQHQAPNCFTGGGGDTVARVNGYDATVVFGNQESLAQEALVTSTDHGDTFPLTRQFGATSAYTGVDRQWISTVDKPGVMAGTVPFEVEALFSYHIPLAGELVAAVGTDGVVRPALAPVIPSVSQSGPSRIDEQPGSLGGGYFYQGYRDGTGFRVGVAPVTSYDSPLAYTIGTVTTDQPVVFPWIALDRAGNLYATWVAPDGQLYYSYSLIADAANNPHAGGHPATKWSPKLKVNPPSLGSTVFPEIVAGDAGRVAIAYMGTGDWTGVSDGAPAGATPARWNTYVSLSQDALSATPGFETGLASHRVDHTGSICTSGTTCIATMGDRSLDDMIDVTVDNTGRPSVVFMDNNNAEARASVAQGSQGPPLVRVSKLAVGPSLYAGQAPYNYSYPTTFRPSAAGDATWPNTAAGKNLPALDILGNGVSVEGNEVVAKIDLADASATGRVRDLAAYNAARGTDFAGTRLQYVERWEHGDDAYYMAAESDGTGKLSFFGGKVDGGNSVFNGTGVVGIAYHPTTGEFSGAVVGNSILIKGSMSFFNLKLGSTLVSYSAHSMAAPPESLVSGLSNSTQLIAIPRQVDASPPMDAVLGLSTIFPSISPVTPAVVATGAGLPPTSRGLPIKALLVGALLVMALLVACPGVRRGFRI
jgi:hypothetical protein